ncbi:MAG TPA: adenosylmethionine--8-amino-7-oxononanoate transaminase [Solirubrobacteraceae bacterium]|jgi:adenosylmethionine-8-amino-7-oxononanoate aminotransferase|nr:adenosylmethionine--8-amino-7-oxononanoate transaminase [Solirubrobacteraceae bacterium]
MSATAGDWQRLLALDRVRVWHPYAPLPAPHPPLPVVSAEGVRLRLADGRELVDGMSSWWCAIHGYRHPSLDEAVSKQLGRVAHVMFGGLTHEPAVRLAERLTEIAPAGLERVFFADSGSVAVEVAIKLALQYQRALGHPGRTRLLTVRGGYHGDTFGAMAVCDPVAGMHSMFKGVLAEHVFADRPPDGFAAPLDPAWAEHVGELLAGHAHKLAAVIVEPVVQGAGGMRFHSPACVALLRRLCDEHGLLLILDEIATGFGRTGALFACEHAHVSPDVMCVGKALTGGYLTLAATLCTPEVADAVSTGQGGGSLMHGPTFMANPLACSVALASLELLAQDAWHQDVGRIELALREGLAPARELPGVADVRVLGAIGVVQMEQEVDLAAASAAAVEQGVWLRPFRDLIYAMPPYVTGEQDLARIAAAMSAAAGAVG